jgi:hypothetical protein
MSLDNSKSMTYGTSSLVAAILCLATPQLTVAEDSEGLHPFLVRGFSLDLGIFYPDRQLDLAVNGTVTGIGDEIHFDEGVRLDNADNTFAAELAWRYRGRWSIVGQYFKSTDSAMAVLEEDIKWGDVVFGAGSNAAVGSQFSLTRIFFGRQLNTSKFHDVGIGAGLHWLHIGAFIEGEILINGTPEGARRSVSVEAPLPNIGVWYKYSMSPRWAFRTRLDLFSANIDEYDGILMNVGFGVNYQAFEYFGIGVNYNYFELDVKINKSDWRGNIETIYDGVYVNASFYF